MAVRRAVMTGRIHDASVLMPINADTTLRHRVIRTLGQSSISICIHSYPRQASGSIQRRPSENEDQDGNGDICFWRSGGSAAFPMVVLFRGWSGLQLGIRAAVGYPRQYLYSGRSRG